MKLLKKYENKIVAIYGMGMTGRSAAKIFKKFKSKIYCWDDNSEIRKQSKKLNYPIKEFWKKKIFCDYIVISPGVDINKCKLTKYLKKNAYKIITDLDVFFELNKDIQTISITGTNGKSTTCKIIEKILKTAGYNVKTVGNIGSPILFLNKINKKNIFIIEVSSYQLQYSRIFRSKHAAILNISSDHLDRHKSIENYTKIKSKIFFAQKRSDYSYINLKNKNSKLVKKIFKKKKLKSKLTIVNKSNSDVILKKINNNYIKNIANKENFAFAYKIAKNLNISDKVIIKAINEFKGLPHRQEIIISNKNLTCVNDSKATSFDASLYSLLNYNNIYWIVGGLPKHQDYFKLKKVKKKIVQAYIIGNSVSFFKRQIKKDIKYQISKNIKNALNQIHKDLRNNKHKKNTILFSPAAASFDQFNNFETRGLFFKNLAIKRFKSGVNV